MNRELRRVLQSMRADTGEEFAAGATARVRAHLETPREDAATADRLNSCADFRALFAAYRDGTLGEARRMLVEDHLHSCVACRRWYQGPEDAVAWPVRAPRSAAQRALPWIVATAAAAIAAVAMAPALDRLLAGSGARASVQSVEGDLFRVADLSPLASGAQIEEGEEIRTGKNSRAVLRLRDGSNIEMAERSDLKIFETFRAKTVHLDRGAVMVEAARQRRGRLQIATADCVVSVKGTIFEVTAGIKGSRVSVVQGQVRMDRGGATVVLDPGDQKSTSVAMAAIPVASDVAWSRNSQKYLALLGELAAIQKRIEQIPAPALRYQSKLAGLLPENTVAFAAIPNPSATLAEATSIFEERVAQNEALREWWNARDSRQLRALVDRVRAFSGYLGDEVVLALAPGAGSPLLVAEVSKPGLREYLAAQGLDGPMVMLDKNVIALSADRPELERVAAIANEGGRGPFLETPFAKTIARSYDSGAGWIFAADMEQILAKHVTSSRSAMTGLGNVQYLMIERKPNLGRTENSATLNFSGDRHGLMSWLGAPSPMGTLDFVSPQASFAASFVVKNPATLVNEVIPIALAQRGGMDSLSQVAANLGGEVTVAVDGPLLPTPAWKAAIEIDNPAAVEAAIDNVARQSGLEVASEKQGGLTFHKLFAPHRYATSGGDLLQIFLNAGFEIDYVFTDGYLLAAPSRALLISAMATRTSGVTLARSAAFRAQLPEDGHANFSALLYYNTGVQLAPILDQLKTLATPEQQKSMAALAADREPGLIYAYAGPDRIFAGSRGGFFGLGLDTLVGLNAKGARDLTGLLAPMFSLHGTRN